MVAELFAAHLTRNRIAAARFGAVRRASALQSLTIILCGCSAAPSQDVFGSFFPAWILCAAIGVAASVVFRQVLVMAGLNNSLIAPPLTYLAVVIAVSLLVWLIWFGG